MTEPAHRSHLRGHRSLHVERVCSSGTPIDTRAVVHPHATLVLFVAGEAVIWCGASFQVGAGDVLAIPEGYPHFIEAARGVEAWVLAFCSSCLSSPAGRALASLGRGKPSGLAAGLWSLDQPDSVAPLFGALEKELAQGEPHHELAVDGYLSLIATAVLRAAPMAGDPAPKNTIAAAALAFIQTRALEGIGLEEVAKAVHRSPTHTAAEVKRATGRTVVEWITHARMATARELLSKTDESVDAIASHLGFSSSSHFHRVFKKTHSLTPAAWRKAHLPSPALRPARGA